MTETTSARTDSTELLIIGSGAAGLSLALSLPESVSVLVLSKGQADAGSTYLAQGGLSAVQAATDSIASHVEDTLRTGAGLCHPDIVRFVVENAPPTVEWLTGLGVEFTRTRARDGRSPFHLTREGGHSHRRVVHAADATGKAIHGTLEQRVRASSNIRILEQHAAIDLIVSEQPDTSESHSKRVVGAYLLNTRNGRIFPVSAPCVVLASGGASKAYLFSTNADASTGDGIAMAWRAGCRVVNMEFTQFHPTCLFHPDARNFLISEAVRGEGGVLRLPDGTRFMGDHDPAMELAPRDIVARAIDHEMKRHGLPCVFLDISHRPSTFIAEHFPNIHRRCLELGLDMCRQPLPVVPAAHYTCGGVWTDRRGRTDIPGLYAVGEVAFTGLHGANRMASNSLLECLVYAHSASLDIMARSPLGSPTPHLPDWDDSRVTDSDEEVVVAHNWDELRRFMWDYVGIVRSNKRLKRARRRIELLAEEIDEYYGNFRVGANLAELRNLAKVAELIIRSADIRKESRGLHYNLDYPEANTDHPPKDTILLPDRKTTWTRTPGENW